MQWLYDHGQNAGCRAICRRLIQSGQIDEGARFFVLNGSGALSIGKLDAFLVSAGEGKVGTKPKDFLGLASGDYGTGFSYNIVRGSGYKSTGLTEETIVHEMLHNATSEVLHLALVYGQGTPAVKKAAKDLDDFAVQIYDIAEKEVRRLKAKKGKTLEEERRLSTAKHILKPHVFGSGKREKPHSRFTRSTELVSYAMSDPEIQVFLRSIPIEEVLKAGEEPRTMLDKFVELIGRLFSPGGRKLPAVEENAWHRALLLSEDVLAASTAQSLFAEKTTGVKNTYSAWRSDESYETTKFFSEVSLLDA